jgi:hypothetical protein
MPTTATSHRSRATLLDVAKSHANSRTLSAATRGQFLDIAQGFTFDPADAAHDTDLRDAFFEAATSCATRAGQSYSRRVMISDLMALREAVYAGQSVLPKVTTMTIKVQGDADAMRRALLDFNHDGTRVVYASEV